MSDKMTSISLPGACGFMDWGYKDRQEMISSYRKMAKRQKTEAEKILAASDSDFVVEQHTGHIMRRNVVRI